MFIGFCGCCARRVCLEVEILDEPILVDGQMTVLKSILVDHNGNDGTRCPGSGQPPIGLVEEEEIPKPDEVPHMDGRSFLEDILVSA